MFAWNDFKIISRKYKYHHFIQIINTVILHIIMTIFRDMDFWKLVNFQNCDFCLSNLLVNWKNEWIVMVVAVCVLINTCTCNCILNWNIKLKNTLNWKLKIPQDYLLYSHTINHHYRTPNFVIHFVNRHLSK